jgi:hypothetical protein
MQLRRLQHLRTLNHSRSDYYGISSQQASRNRLVEYGFLQWIGAMSV